MKMKIIKSLLSIAVVTAFSSAVQAAPIGTAASTQIDNVATISYSVGGASQTGIASSPTGNNVPGTTGTPTSFVVDKKIDLLVTGGNTKGVTSGLLGATGTGATAADTGLTFTLTNEGNSTEEFNLTPSGTVTGDDFETSGCVVRSVDVGGTVTTSSAVTLDSGDVATVTVECDIPTNAATAIGGNDSLVDLLAVYSTTAATTGGDTTGVDTVYADGVGTGTDTGGETGSPTVTGERNAKHSATSSYVISTADLTVQKTEAINGMWVDANQDGVIDSGEVTTTGTDRYHIPGSTVTYTITVSNGAAAPTATNIIINDVVPSATMTVVGTPTVSVAGGAAQNATTGTSNTVASPAFSLLAGESAVMTIVARINYL